MTLSQVEALRAQVRGARGIISANVVGRAANHMRQHRWAILFIMVVVVTVANVPMKPAALDKSVKIGATTVHYKVVLPKNYDPSKTYPGILGSVGGPQTMNAVDNVIAWNFRDEAEKRGYDRQQVANDLGALRYKSFDSSCNSVIPPNPPKSEQVALRSDAA
jgi:hypothetical protein